MCNLWIKKSSIQFEVFIYYLQFLKKVISTGVIMIVLRWCILCRFQKCLKYQWFSSNLQRWTVRSRDMVGSDVSLLICFEKVTWIYSSPHLLDKELLLLHLAFLQKDHQRLIGMFSLSSFFQLLVLLKLHSQSYARVCQLWHFD